MLGVSLEIRRVVVTGLLAVAAFSLVVMPHWAMAQGSPDLTSKSLLWFGQLDAGARHFRFLVTVEWQGEGWAGSLLSLDEGEMEFPLSDIVWDGSKFEFRITSSSALYSGAADRGGKQVEGNWKQRGAELALNFQRVEARPEEVYDAVWSGTIEVLFQELDMRFRELKSGEVYLDSLTQKAGGFVATKTVDGKRVVFDVPAVKGKFEG